MWTLTLRGKTRTWNLEKRWHLQCNSDCMASQQRVYLLPNTALPISEARETRSNNKTRAGMTVESLSVAFQSLPFPHSMLLLSCLQQHALRPLLLEFLSNCFEHIPGRYALDSA